MRPLAVTFVALAALLAGVVEAALCDEIRPGHVLSHPWDHDEAAPEQSFATDVDDVEGDLDDRGWLPCDPVPSAGPRAGSGRFRVAGTGCGATGSRPACAGIRGPPARG